MDKRENISSVIRVVKTKNYTVMSNKHLRSKHLSLKAKGLMSLCLSLPENWDYTINGLTALSKDGRDAIISTIKELKENGFVDCYKERTNKGFFQSVYTFYEDPEDNEKFITTRSENPTRLNLVGLSEQVEPDRLNLLGKPDQLINTNNNYLDDIHVNSKEFTPDDLMNLFKKICVDFPTPRSWNATRRKKAVMRLEENPQETFWQTVFEKAEKSNFIRQRKWFSFDWVLRNSNNASKVYEGNYDNNKVTAITRNEGTDKYASINVINREL